MAIQMRRGQQTDFDPDKLSPGEWAVSLDRKYIYMCFAPGDVRRMSTYEEMVQNIQDATTDVAAQFTAEVQAAILEALQSAADADLSSQEADAAATRANTAADRANGVSDDLISKRDSGFFNGPQGTPGAAATIQVGTVTASAPGGDPQVTNAGTSSAAVFNFVIPRGAEGPAGSQEIFQLARADFPATGQPDALYVDISADPAVIYYWDGADYVQAGGAGGGGGSAAVVTFLRSGWTAGDSGYTQTMSVPGLTDAAEPQLQLPKNATAVQAAVWDSIKKSVPAAGNLTLTVDSQPGTDLDVIILSLPAQEGTAVGDIAALSQRITAAQADADALRTDVDEINANLAADEGVITSGNQVISYTRQSKLVTLDIRANDVTAGGTIATLPPTLCPTSAQSRYIWVTTSASASGTTLISISTGGGITTTGTIYRATFSISYLCA